MNYIINTDSLVFLDIDEMINNQTTIAYDWKNDDVIKINTKVYLLLKHIWQKGNVNENELNNYLENDFLLQNDLKKIIKDFTQRGILLVTENS